MGKLKNAMEPVKDELQEAMSVSGVIDFVEILVGCIAHDPMSWAKFANIIKDHSISITQKIPIYQLGRYLSGIQKVEEDLGKSCELSNKLFGDEKTRRDNGFRVYKYVTDAENDKKIDLLVDTTRAFLLNCIDLSTFFRIYKAIVETLPEDLDYLKEITRERLKNNTEIFQGNTEILALSRNGMMIIAGIDGNNGVEEQDYTISSFGYIVDRYTLSFNDDEKQKLYEKYFKKNKDTFLVDKND